MKGDSLPSNDHVVRYIKPSMIEDDGKANGAEFRLRPHRPDETGLSVNWLEIFGPNKDVQLAEVRRLYRLEVKKKGRFAELNVGSVCRKVIEEIEIFGILHDPLGSENGFEADPSHSEIVGLPPGDTDLAILVGDMIAECVSALHVAINMPDGSETSNATAS